MRAMRLRGISFPVARSQRREVPSWLPVNTLWPSGAKATVQMVESCRKRTVPRRINAPGGRGSPVKLVGGSDPVAVSAAADSSRAARKERNVSAAQRTASALKAGSRMGGSTTRQGVATANQLGVPSAPPVTPQPIDGFEGYQDC